MMSYVGHPSQSSRVLEATLYCPIVPGGFAERRDTGDIQSMTARVRFDTDIPVHEAQGGTDPI